MIDLVATTTRGHFFYWGTKDETLPCVNCGSMDELVQVTATCHINWKGERTHYEFPVCGYTCGQEFMELLDDAIYGDPLRQAVALALIEVAALGI